MFGWSSTLFNIWNGKHRTTDLNIQIYTQDLGMVLEAFATRRIYGMIHFVKEYLSPSDLLHKSPQSLNLNTRLVSIFHYKCDEKGLSSTRDRGSSHSHSTSLYDSLPNLLRREMK